MQKMKAALKMEILRDEDEEAAKKQKELEEQGCSVWKLTLLTKSLSQLNGGVSMRQPRQNCSVAAVSRDNLVKWTEMSPLNR